MRTSTSASSTPRSPLTRRDHAAADTATADEEIASYVARAGRRGGSPERVPALSAWLQQMEKYPQLSPDAQAELVVAYQDAVAAADELKERGLRGAAARGLRRRASRADESITYLLGANFRLILVIARDQAQRRYSARSKVMEVLGDLVQEGNVALVEAAGSFEDGRGPNFPTYAARAVRDRIRGVLQRNGPMHLPPSWVRMYRIAQHERADLAAEIGRPPTTEELQVKLWERCMGWAAEHLTTSQQMLPAAERETAMIAKLRKQGMVGAIEHIDEILAFSPTAASLESPVGDDGSSSLREMIRDDNTDRDPFDEVEHDELASDLTAALSELTDREQRIVALRYGFVDNQKHTYAQIAEEFDVSAERIRQIERAVLDKLRSPAGQFSFLTQHLEDQFDDDVDY